MSLFLFILFAGCYNQNRFIKVKGQCFKNVAPDKASLSFYAVAVNEESGKAVEEATRIYNSTHKHIKSMNLKDMSLKTIQNSVQESFDWSNGERKFKGYRASMGLRVTTSDAKSLGKLIPKLSSFGVTRVDSIIQEVTSAQLQEAKESCLVEAVKNARAKAQKIAQASEAKLGKTLQVLEGGSTSPMQPYRMAESSRSTMLKAKSLEVEVSAQEVSLSVEASFELVN